MGIPFVVVASGGLPVINTPNGIPMDLASNGFGIPVTIATDGFGIAVNLNGYSAGGGYVPTYPYYGF
jgi:hypothetical protein